MNIVVIEGVLARSAEVRELPSGEEVVSYEVTVRDGDGAAETVPVVWHAATGREPRDQGDGVVVTGRVRRRFFRNAGATLSRTEVVADAVVDASDRRRVRRAIDRAAAPLQATTVRRDRRETER